MAVTLFFELMITRQNIMYIEQPMNHFYDRKTFTVILN